MTGGELEKFLYEGMKALVASDKAAASPMVSPALSGGVYYRGTRPMQNEQGAANKEDIVVAVLTGNEKQFQKGSCVVNIYIPDIRTASGATMRNKERTDIVEAWAKTLPKQLTRRGDILFEKSGMVMTLQEEALREHFVSLKMDFTLLNESFD